MALQISRLEAVEGAQPADGPGARFINRELSWLDYNARVLEYAADPDECFQNSGQSVFSIEMLNGAAQRLKTLAGLADITLDPTVDCCRLEPTAD